MKKVLLLVGILLLLARPALANVGDIITVGNDDWLIMQRNHDEQTGMTTFALMHTGTGAISIMSPPVGAFTP